ncbi:MAG TPA: hypothetical protein VGA77_04335 [Propylenella sp.]
MTMCSSTFGGTIALRTALALASILPSATAVYAVAGNDRWATVRANATLVRGKGVTSVTGFVAGIYEVEFDKKVVDCLYIATLGTGSPGTAQLGQIGAAPAGHSNQNTVVIRTRNSAGVGADLPFHLFVGCK